jgi:hypothetical protein
MPHMPDQLCVPAQGVQLLIIGPHLAKQEGGHWTTEVGATLQVAAGTRKALFLGCATRFPWSLLELKCMDESATGHLLAGTWLGLPAGPEISAAASSNIRASWPQLTCQQDYWGSWKGRHLGLPSCLESAPPAQDSFPTRPGPKPWPVPTEQAECLPRVQIELRRTATEFGMGMQACIARHAGDLLIALITLRTS